MSESPRQLAPFAVPGLPLAGPPMFSARLLTRLEALGVAAGTLSPEGVLTFIGAPQPVEALIASAPVFQAQARRRFQELAQNAGVALEIWPGLHLLTLPAERRRRTPKLGAAGTPIGRDDRLLVALILGPELLESEQLALVCDNTRQDLRATIARVEPARLVSAGQLHRLAQSIAWMQQDNFEIERCIGELHAMSTQLGESYEELSLLYKLSTSMTVNQAPAHFLTEACRELRQVVGLRWLALQLIDSDTRLNELGGKIFVAGPTDCDTQMLKRIGEQLMVQQPVGFQPMVIDDTHTLGIAHLPRIAKHLLVVWLLREEKPLGILFGGDKLDGAHISSVDSKLCNSLAASLAMFLENMMLFEDMSQMFLGTLHALTSSIDAKDSYTHGHSERVALMSRLLAEAAGLDDHTVERVYISGLVHDVGKIGVPEAVLTKPGKLTNEEFELIKMHPEIGAKILQDIRQMQDLIPGVLYHHERWDGRGYPHKVVGENIPLFGRLICLADSFDAMSSDRAYRKSLTLEKALDEVRRCAGTQFDPRLAEVFVKLDFDQYFEMLSQHQVSTQSPVLPAGPAQAEGQT